MIRFTLLLTKGIIRDQTARRKLMFWLVLVALGMVFTGAVFISDAWAKEHPWLFFAFWGVCAWITITVLLLALLDILLIRAMHRAARRELERRIADDSRKEPRL